MLELKNIYKTFNPGTINEKVALNGLNLTLNEGDFVTVIGGNGAGKSTMLNAVAGTWQIDEGQIIISLSCLAGSDDRNRCYNGNRRKPCPCITPWKNTFTETGNHKERA